MIRSAFRILAAGAALSLGGCANLARNLSQSDDLLDFAMALRGHEHIEAFPLQLKSRGSGRIATGHAHKDAKGILISGTVEKRGPGWISAAWSHVDVARRPTVCIDRKQWPRRPVSDAWPRIWS